MTEREWRRNRIVVLMTVALVFGGFTMVISFLPFYLQELGVDKLSLNAGYSGALISISPLLAAVTGPWWGRLADRHGLKPMALRAVLAFVVSWITFGLATRVYHLAIARAIGGIFGGFNALSIPLATVGCPPDKMGSTIGAIQSTRTASIALGPLVGGFLADWMGPRNTAFLASALYFVSFLLLLFFYRDVPLEQQKLASESRLKMRELFARWEMVPLFAMLFLASFMERGLGPIVPLLVLDFGTSPSRAAPISGAVLSAAALASALSAWWTGKLTARHSPIALLRLMTGASAVAAIPLVFASTVPELAIYRFVLGLMAGGILTVTFLLGSFCIPPKSRGMGMGILTSAVLLGNALGPLLVGFMAALGLRLALSVGAALFSVMFWISWRAMTPIAAAQETASS